MKKIILISGAVIFTIILVAVGWYLFLRNPDTPLGETISDLLPFGSGDNTQPTTNDEQSTTETDGQIIFDEFGAPTQNLYRLSETPVAGFVLLNKGTSTTIARYVDRATGHIYDVDLMTLKKTKITNQTLPKVYEAYFRWDGTAVLFRSLREDSDVVENFSLALTAPKVTATSSLEADALYTITSTILRGNIGSVVTGSGDSLIYSLGDVSSIVSSAFNGSGLKTLFSSPFYDWSLAATGNNLVVYTKASASVSGYAYTLNTSNGTLTKILGPLNGLTATPNTSGNRVLYSYVEDNKTKLFVKNLVNGDAVELSITTLAEKCVWSKKRPTMVFCGSPFTDVGSNEQDNWYKGITNFNDRIWSFDADAEIAQVLAEPINILGFDLDIIEPRLSPNEDYLVFINKIDLSLWALRLGELE